MAVFDNSPGVTLSREQAAQLAYQAGARGEDLVFLTGIAQGESAYRPGVHRTDSARDKISGDRGLWQINYIWDNRLISAGIIRQKSDLFDPLTNARAAMYVLQHQGRAAWNSFSGSMGANQRVNWDAARSAVQNASSRGLLGADFNASGSQASVGGSTTTSGGAASGPIDLPSDAKLVRSPDGGVWAMFDVGNGVILRYGVPASGVNFSWGSVQQLSWDQYNSRYGRAVDAGNAEELKFVGSSFGTYAQHWNSILDTVIGTSNPARHDPEVLRVLAEFAGRPDMERAELENKLQATQWFQQRTQGQLEWNDLSEAERVKRRGDTRAQIERAFTEFAADTSSWGDISSWVEDVASGKTGFGEFVETVVKPRALNNPESPWSRTVRSEQEAQRQRPIDIENTVSRIRDELERYGLRWDAATLMNWAKGIVEKHYSDDDLTQTLEQQAQALYPGLGPLNGADVATLAVPWLETYERVLEQKGSLFTPEIRSALAQGTPVWDMEVALTKSSKWLGTRNADDRMHTLADQVGEMFGY